MDIRKLQRAIVDGLEDVKAQNIAVFNTEHLSSMFERVIIASGTSNRQTKALAASVRDSVKARGMPVLATEGEDNGEWIIVDCGAAVAHIMQPSIRDYYHLEEIWGAKSVRMKMGETQGGLVKASEPAPPLGRSNAARKGHALAAEPKRAPAKKAPAKKAVAKRAANQSAAFKRVTAKKAPARGLAARPATARKAPAKKAPAKKTAPRAR